MGVVRGLQEAEAEVENLTLRWEADTLKDFICRGKYPQPEVLIAISIMHRFPDKQTAGVRSRLRRANRFR